MSRHVRLAAALAAALALTSTGCSVTNEAGTVLDYEPSDGVRGELGDIRLGNLMVLAAEEGGAGTLMGYATSGATGSTRLTFALDDGTELGEVTVDAGSTVRLGPDADATFDLDAVPARPGALLDVRVSAEPGGGVVVPVPVLDGTLPEYADLVPQAGDDTDG